MITSVEYDSFLNKLTCYGYDFGNIQSPSGNVNISPYNTSAWTPLSSIDLWSDTYIKGAISGTLVQGSYDVQIFSSSGAEFDLSGGFTVSAGSYLDYGYMPNGFLTKSPVTTNDQYFSERRLFDLLITEAYNKHGVSMIYYPISFDVNYDKLYGEDLDRKIIRKFNLMVFYTLPRVEKLWSKFGIEGMDNFSMFCSKKHFQVASQYDYTQTSASFGVYVPKIGDIIRALYNNYYYEIVDIKEESGQYLQSPQHMWEFLVKPYRDTRLSLSATTSATMTGAGDIGNYINRTPDIFDIKTDVVDKNANIDYQPEPCEVEDKNQFWN